jgi:hypothetical protein
MVTVKLKKELPKVLLVMNDPQLPDLFTKQLHGVVQIFHGSNFETARQMFAEHREDLAFIAFAGAVEKQNPKVADTVPLVAEFLEQGFPKGKMICISGRGDYQSQLKVAGCGRAVEKIGFSLFIKTLLMIGG